MQEEAIHNQFLRKMLGSQKDQNGGGTGSGARTTPVSWLDMKDCALNEFKTEGLCTLPVCFSALSPYGIGGPTDVA